MIMLAASDYWQKNQASCRDVMQVLLKQLGAVKIPDRANERKNVIQIFEVDDELERNEEALRQVFKSFFEKTKQDLISCGH